MAKGCPPARSLGVCYFLDKLFKPPFPLRRAIRRIRPDIIHARGPMSAALATAARRGCGEAKVVFDCRGVWAEEFQMTGGYRTPPLAGKRLARLVDRCSRIEERAARQADGFVAVTRRLAEYSAKRYGRLFSPLAIVPCCADGGRFAFDQEARGRVRAELGIESEFLWVYTGSAAAWQEPEALLNALAASLRADAGRRLLVLSRDKDVFSALARQCGLTEEQVIIRSAAPEDVPLYLSASDAAIVLRRDSIVNRVASPVKCAEYLCNGLSVLISSEVGEYSRLIEEKGWGQVAPSFEAAGKLAGEMRPLAGDERISRGREAADLLDWRANLPKLIQLYETTRNTSPRYIAHINHKFPETTQTFTYREVAALWDKDLDLRVFALHGKGHPVAGEAMGFVQSTRYLPGAFSVCSLRANFRRLLRQPFAYSRWLRRCLLSPYPNADGWAQRAQSLMQFLRAPLLAEAVASEPGAVNLHAQFADGAATTAMIAADYLGVAFSFYSHTSFNTQLLAEKLRQADFVASISEHDRGLLAAAWPDAACKIHVIHCGLALSEWPMRTEGGKPGSIIAVGSLIEKKGHAQLLNACRCLKDEGIPFNCRIVGGGPLRPYLQQQREDLQLQHEVTFTGALTQEEIRPQLYASSVFALACVRTRAGDTDGIPVALMEAMAAGVPVVSTMISGIPELIENGRSGRLVEPGDTQALANAIGDALSNEARNAELVQEARTRIEQEFSLASQGSRMAECFRRFPRTRDGNA